MFVGNSLTEIQSFEIREVTPMAEVIAKDKRSTRQAGRGA